MNPFDLPEKPLFLDVHTPAARQEVLNFVPPPEAIQQVPHVPIPPLPPESLQEFAHFHELKVQLEKTMKEDEKIKRQQQQNTQALQAMKFKRSYTITTMAKKRELSGLFQKFGQNRSNQ
jgi:hypothetical protein